MDTKNLYNILNHKDDIVINDKDLNTVFDHFYNNISNLTERLSGEELEMALSFQYMHFLWRWFWVVNSNTSADLITVRLESDNYIDKLLDLEFMKKYFMKQIEDRQSKDDTTIKRGIRNYKRYYGLN